MRVTVDDIQLKPKLNIAYGRGEDGAGRWVTWVGDFRVMSDLKAEVERSKVPVLAEIEDHQIILIITSGEQP